jgi:ribonuclease-3
LTNHVSDLQELAARLGLTEANLPVLEQALTHKSLVPDDPLRSNERLEFLGDAVLGLVINEYLYKTFPKKMEGELAKAKALIVCQATLAAAARRLALIPLLRIGRSEEAMGGRNRASLIGDAFEALVAVLYQEYGYERARDFILTELAPEIAHVGTLSDWRDAKTILQEQRQGRRKSPPHYRLLKQEGLPHDRTFTIVVELDGQAVGQGIGKSKREAEQAAAQATLEAQESAARGSRQPKETISQAN